MNEKDTSFVIFKKIFHADITIDTIESKVNFFTESYLKINAPHAI